jgi:hypothetical protein
VSNGRLFIRYTADTTVAIDINGESGTLNGRFKFGFYERRMMMCVLDSRILSKNKKGCFISKQPFFIYFEYF